MASDNERSRLDDAARAGWLYYIAGNTQDEIAKRPEGLARDRAAPGLALPLGAADHLPPGTPDRRLHGARGAAAAEIRPGPLRGGPHQPGGAPMRSTASPSARRRCWRQRLRSEKPAIVAIGTGRAMRAAVEQVPPMDCPNHQIVSLVGNISPTARPASSMLWRASPTSPRRGIIRCRCRSSSPPTPSASSS